MSLTDPSGYSFVGDVFGAIAGFHKKVFNWIVQAGKAVGKWVAKNWKAVVVTISAVAASVLTVGALAGPSSSITVAFWASTAAGAAGGFTAGALGTALNGGSVSDIFIQGVKGAAIGAVSAGLTFGVGHLGANGTSIFHSLGKVGETIGKDVAHGLVQGGMSKLQGGNFASGAIGGALSSVGGSFYEGKGLTHSAIRVAVAAVAGGTAAEIAGGDFVNGAISGAYVQMFNDMASHLTFGYNGTVPKEEFEERMLLVQNGREYELQLIMGTPVVDDKVLLSVLRDTYLDIQKAGISPSMFYLTHMSIMIISDTVFHAYKNTAFMYTGFIGAEPGYYRGEHINYIGVGAAFAAHGDSSEEMHSMINNWNKIQYRHDANPNEHTWADVGSIYYRSRK